ncbi:leucine--tRNA ligase [Buchnera aphidicola]|uniref:Leucine--tRNA ligase n=1 Tax=Buchnera aphidicola (Stegophylla sp.) TaxID=2315800 RepID=A0A4D6YEK1_9GAMM|nr:leucine--tRNA ligase [Buchnera aphidicola (Stegophylla sp.)]
MKKKYIPEIIESYVQKYWDKHKTFQVQKNIKKKKYYCLSMLPYPSGRLHMGHVRNYTISDVIARHQRMLGKNVLHPIGWDAFGLPAEEAAIKNNTIPSKWTYKNIKFMKKQLKKLGFSYDWNREITTCDPKYYRWEQWFFNKLYEKNLVYKKKSLVNWCPYDKTVLANEQVNNGKCWRCQSNIIFKFIPQWFIKITKYAEKLLQDLNLLKKWPKKVIKMQKNWIGKSNGFEINFNIHNKNKKIKIYTTQLEKIMGMTYVSISPYHPLAITESKKNHKIKKFITKICYKNKIFNKNIHAKILGIKIKKNVLHPITKQIIPIWITNHLILENNINITISIPAHNKYDWKFAVKYRIDIKNVISSKNPNILHQKNTYKNLNTEFLSNSNQFNGLNNQIGSKKIFDTLHKNNIIKKKKKYKLQDWSISRQRYWGTPIPMVRKKNGTIVPISNNQLPITPPKINNMQELKNIDNIYKKWSKTKINNQSVIREIDTFDTFMESSWYYIRYTNPHYHKGMTCKNDSQYWLPVDQYIGGIEHATMHLIYFRFYHKLLYDFNLVTSKEPVIQLLCQGMVLNHAFYHINDKGQKIWMDPNTIKYKKDTKGNIKKIISNNHKIIYSGMIKMSKSKNNGIEPELIIQKYGADTIRLFIMFSAPVDSELEWNESGVQGMYRFLQKLWDITYMYRKNIKKNQHNKIQNQNIEKKLQSELNITIFEVSYDIKYRQSFHTAISKIIKFTNSIFHLFIKNQINHDLMKNILNTIIKMLYPFTPHFSFILWKKLKNKNTIDYVPWPKYNLKFIQEKYNNIIIQINGKKKEIITVQHNTSQEKILKIIKKINKIKIILQKYIIIKIIFIENKLINLIVQNKND